MMAVKVYSIFQRDNDIPYRSFYEKESAEDYMHCMNDIYEMRSMILVDPEEYERLKSAYVLTETPDVPVAVMPSVEYDALQARVKELEAFKSHMLEVGALCEKEPGESQKDCEICWPR